MSKQDDVTRVKLGAIQGTMIVFHNENRFSRMDIKKAITACMAAVDVALAAMSPCAVMHNYRWVKARWLEYRDFLMAEPDRDFNDSAAFTYMCSRLIGDIVDEFGHNPKKMAYIQPISDAIETILNFCDHDGKNRVAYEKSKKWLNKLDEIMGLETV